jgi:hypothetical protein
MTIIFRGSVCMSQMRAAATWLIVVTALVGAFARPARGQNLGVIEGTVADEQGGVMPGVTLTLRNTETGVERAVTTAGAGAYRFPGAARRRPTRRGEGRRTSASATRAPPRALLESSASMNAMISREIVRSERLPS